MYTEIPNGSFEIIQGLKCHIPPKGSIINPLTRKLEQINVARRSTVTQYNWWERDKRWDDYFEKWDKWLHEEKIQQAKKPDYEHPELKKNHPKLKIRNRGELDEFIAECWKYRLGGYWFSNNGQATYITGRHWYYLSCYNMDGGLPSYREIDREFFYFWEYCVNDPKCFGAVETTKRRNGKCFSINTLCRMADGSVRKIQDIRDGDFVMGDDSKPRLVYGTTSGREEMYEIIPKKGKSFTVNKSHILYGVKKETHKEFTITVEDYLKLSDCQKSLLMIKRAGWDYEEKPVNIDPYFLGLWLGDGMSKNCEICNEDSEVIDYLKEYAERCDLTYYNYGQKTLKGVRLRHSLSYQNAQPVKYKGVTYKYKTDLMKALGKHPKTPLIGMGLFKSGEIEALPYKGNWLWAEMVSFGLKNNKHIPLDYKENSRGVRLGVLAGLLDADGSLVKKNGYPKHYQIAFSNKYARLRIEAKELIQSLGYYCGEIDCPKTNSKTLLIYGDIHLIPTKVKRKQAAPVVRKYNSLLCGFDVKPVGVDDYYGFAVDDNHLFLLADGTVVHNSYRGGCIGLEWASRMAEFNVGMQSKTDTDADKLFKKTIIAPFRKLPFFFMPMTDLPHSGKVPAKWLKFYSGKVSTDDDELESMIDFQASGIMAYDGQKLGYWFGDEEGKTKLISVNDRWEVVRFCLKDHTGKIIGKALHTSTVEDMDSGGGEYFKMWKGSNQFEMTNGETPSGLYRFFMPADRTRHIDRYGFSNTELARAEILQERLAVEDNPRVLSQRKRKEPLEEREAFQADAESCVFSNPVALNERYDELKYIKPQYKIGNFHWKNGIQDGEVEFIEAPNGRFKVMYEPPEEIRNLCIKRVDGFEPNNKELFCAGIDPYDHTFLTKESEKRMSMGAICIIKKPSPIFESKVEDAPALLYLTRPDMPHMFYEDAIKCLKYYGCQALIENNKGNIFDHFNDRGYSAYAAWLPNKDKAGIANTARTKGGGINGSIAEMTDQFLTDHVQKVYFEELIEQFLEFTPMDTTKYDAVMAFGYALMLQKSALSKMQDRKDTRPIENYLSFFKRR